MRGWTLPGGLIDRGETPAAAIKRELVEELGIDVDVDGVEPWILMDSAMRRIDVGPPPSSGMSVRVDHGPDSGTRCRRLVLTRRSPADRSRSRRRDSLIKQVRAGGSYVLVR